MCTKSGVSALDDDCGTPDSTVAAGEISGPRGWWHVVRVHDHPCLHVHDLKTIAPVVVSKIYRALLGKITTVKYRGIFRGNW